MSDPETQRPDIERLIAGFGELRRFFEALGEQMAGVWPQLAASWEALSRAGLIPPALPADPWLAAIEARRTRNTGPPQQQRAPRRIVAVRARQ